MLKQRVITAVILAILAIWALFFSSEQQWLIAIAVVAFIAAWEWAGFAMLAQAWQKGIYALLTLGIGYAALTWLTLENLALLTLLEIVVLTRIVSRYQRTQGQPVWNSVGAVLVLGWLFIPVFAVVMIEFRELFSPELLLLSMASIWAMDTGAYFSGRRFGSRKLAQYVSPGKTWEGVYGGALFAFVALLVGLLWLQPNFQSAPVFLALVAAGIALFSVMGDLFESVLKRQAGLKDSGHILPGHGGVLDRIDSLLIAIPMFFIFWAFAGGHL